MATLSRRSLLVRSAGALALAALPRPLRAAGTDAGLADIAADRGLKLGVAVARHELEAWPEFGKLVESEASVIVPSLELKWARLRPSERRFDFADADFMMDFARHARKEVRGHTLLWHEAMPTWLSASIDAMPASELRALLEDHIQRVCGRYAGRIQSWDVINEAIEPGDRQPGGLRASPFYRRLGRDYIELAFRAAAAADPDARLVINDFNLEMAVPSNDARRRVMLELLNHLVRKRVPVHALGIQAHISASESFDPQVFRSFVRSVASLGIEVYITELDVADRDLPADIPSRDQAVAETYRRFLDGALAEPAVKMVVLWGLTDRGGWMNDSLYVSRRDHLPVRANLYDADFRRKPAWAATAQALTDAPPRLE